MRGVRVTVTAPPNVAVSSITPPTPQVSPDGRLVNATDSIAAVVFLTSRLAKPSASCPALSFNRLLPGLV